MRGLALIGSLGILVVVVALLAWALISRVTSASGAVPAGGGATSAPPTTTSPSAASPVASAPPATAAATSTGPPVTLTGVVLRCVLDGQRIHATVSFASSAPVAVTLVAGDTLTTETASGQAQVTVSGASYPATCSALVAGHSYGPIRAT